MRILGSRCRDQVSDASDPFGSHLAGCGDLAIDKAYGDSYIRIMSIARRLLLIAVLASYVAGLGVLAATSSAMAGTMVMGEAGEMGDCQGCNPVGGDDPVSACDTPCLIPLMATVTSDAALWVPQSEQAVDAAGSSFASRTGPPDSSPPRSIRLS